MGIKAIARMTDFLRLDGWSDTKIVDLIQYMGGGFSESVRGREEEVSAPEDDDIDSTEIISADDLLERLGPGAGNEEEEENRGEDALTPENIDQADARTENGPYDDWGEDVTVPLNEGDTAEEDRESLKDPDPAAEDTVLPAAAASEPVPVQEQDPLPAKKDDKEGEYNSQSSDSLQESSDSPSAPSSDENDTENEKADPAPASPETEDGSGDQKPRTDDSAEEKPAKKDEGDAAPRADAFPDSSRIKNRIERLKERAVFFRENENAGKGPGKQLNRQKGKAGINHSSVPKTDEATEKADADAQRFPGAAVTAPPQEPAEKPVPPSDQTSQDAAMLSASSPADKEVHAETPRYKEQRILHKSDFTYSLLNIEIVAFNGETRQTSILTTPIEEKDGNVRFMGLLMLSNKNGTPFVSAPGTSSVECNYEGYPLTLTATTDNGVYSVSCSLPSGYAKDGTTLSQTEKNMTGKGHIIELQGNTYVHLFPTAFVNHKKTGLASVLVLAEHPDGTFDIAHKSNDGCTHMNIDGAEWVISASWTKDDTLWPKYTKVNR